MVGQGCQSTKVYPRVCGGTESFGPDKHRAYGLSPRVRGNREVKGFHGLPLRSIPACAGEPSARSLRMASTTVYPRVCGGTAEHSPDDAGGRGLSPRVRGNPCEI